MGTDPAAVVVERYLATIADPGAPADALAPLVHPAARFVEHPNLVAPAGRERDAAAARAALEHSRSLMAAHGFAVREHIVVGERVVTRATWTGTLAAAAGPLAAGTELRADCCMVFTVRDGLIHRQENYDCYHPVAPPAATG